MTKNTLVYIPLEIICGTNSEGVQKKARANAERFFAQFYKDSDLDTFSAVLQLFREFDQGKLNVSAITNADTLDLNHRIEVLRSELTHLAQTHNFNFQNSEVIGCSQKLDLLIAEAQEEKRTERQPQQKN
ncbi:hypothetical protein A8L34_28030 [Bacillus sp. FJAT-27264]|uniref:aspartyl-phosphate phosphatase Spo0E family protein n=1 Tax=Paenibacillus sp. (strain DSM 101736 / FJAT-27264) TaxID=1850362 RepID=UPI000807B0C4|nr:aspartyl-phosphate phosphatase Spo0E family protein [Bacillus sp. FJAT-27264]OBZ15898.1 hypothetical protein A8L34_28030 [Bacillus sp. FJAT-27264]